MSGVRQLINKPPKSTEAINQDTWLIELLDTTLGHYNAKNNKGKFYPSSLGSVCNRFLYFSYNGLMPNQYIEPTLQRIFDCGDALGTRFEKYFERMGVLLGVEVPVKCENPVISGRIDFVIKHTEYPQALVELKSINSRGFKALLDKPKPDHVVQIQIYLNLYNVDHGIVLYENKNDQQVKAFVVKRDEEAWKKIQDRCFTIMNMSEPPDKCTGPKYCPCRGVECPN